MRLLWTSVLNNKLLSFFFFVIVVLILLLSLCIYIAVDVSDKAAIGSVREVLEYQL